MPKTETAGERVVNTLWPAGDNDEMLKTAWGLKTRVGLAASIDGLIVMESDIPSTTERYDMVAAYMQNQTPAQWRELLSAMLAKKVRKSGSRA